MVVHNLQFGLGRITLHPNRSASWATNRWVILGLGSFTILVAIGWSLIGAWMVLPFAGLEIALLAVLLTRVSRRVYGKQVIYVDRETIRIESSIDPTLQSWSFPRTETRIHFIKPDHPLDGPTFRICHHQSVIAIGDFLNPDDREILQQLLKTTGITIMLRDNSPPTLLEA